MKAQPFVINDKPLMINGGDIEFCARHPFAYRDPPSFKHLIWWMAYVGYIFKKQRKDITIGAEHPPQHSDVRVAEEIAQIVRKDEQTVRRWLKRYMTEGIERLANAPHYEVVLDCSF